MLAQDQHGISAAPLQTLVGGWSGAMVFLVSVTHQTSGRVEHLILKLDRKSKTARTDETSRHVTVQSKSPADFANEHLASLAFERESLATPVALRMLRVGERTGNMGEMMDRAATFHDEEMARWADWATRLIGPVLMLLMGVMIGGIVVLMYLPIFQLTESVR